ncbi:uncharacterized protein DS421_11g329570 [Arachis hypogaea]|nr:uncharacterized protein DS421_11g329570 [Arachis hypogaea]
MCPLPCLLQFSLFFNISFCIFKIYISVSSSSIASKFDSSTNFHLLINFCSS